MKVASLALPVPVFQEFSYFLPSPLDDTVRVGSIVEVEFHQRLLMGLVCALQVRNEENLKPILRIVPVSPWGEKQMDWAKRLSKIYFLPLGEIAQLFFPPCLPSQWKFLEQRVFTQDGESRWDIPSGGRNLFIFRETFRVSSRTWQKLLKEGLVRLERERTFPQESSFPEKRFFWWRILFTESRRQWCLEMIENAQRERRKILLVFPDFHSLDSFEAFIRKRCPLLRVIKYDSRLSAKKRLLAFRLVEEGEYDLILGTRLALFLPAFDLYYHVIFDPEEKGHFSDQIPRYSALRVLYEKLRIKGGELHVVGIVPPLGIAHFLREGEFEERDFPENNLPKRKTVKTITYESRKQRLVLAPPIREEIARVTAQGASVLLWVQKMGYASALGCGDCGFYYMCPDCEVALRYHLDSKFLWCPRCGRKVEPADACPICRGTLWENWGEGLEKVHAEIQTIFPKHHTLRIDSEMFVEGQELLESKTPYIVVGTSAILREELLRRSALLVVVSLESWLYLSDFNAREEFYVKWGKALQLLGVDVALNTQVFVQGSKEAITRMGQFLKSWREFYSEGLEKRRVLGYPPFGYLLRIIGESRNKDACLLVLKSLQEELEKKGMTVIGPFPGSGFRKRGRWKEELGVCFPEQDLEAVFETVVSFLPYRRREGITWDIEVDA